MSLKSDLVRLAHENPELRPHLLPLLRTAQSGSKNSVAAGLGESFSAMADYFATNLNKQLKDEFGAKGLGFDKSVPGLHSSAIVDFEDGEGNKGWIAITAEWSAGDKNPSIRASVQYRRKQVRILDMEIFDWYAGPQALWAKFGRSLPETVLNALNKIAMSR